MGIAKRRHDRDRFRAKAMRLYPEDKIPSRFADNLTACSCYMCGNPRKYFGELTLQERKANEAFNAVIFDTSCFYVEYLAKFRGLMQG